MYCSNRFTFSLVFRASLEFLKIGVSNIDCNRYLTVGISLLKKYFDFSVDSVNGLIYCFHKACIHLELNLNIDSQS